MPRKPLSEYNLDNTADDNGAHQAAPIIAAGTNVGVMAKRIRQMEREKRQVYQPPAERPLAGDYLVAVVKVMGLRQILPMHPLLMNS